MKFLAVFMVVVLAGVLVAEALLRLGSLGRNKRDAA